MTEKLGNPPPGDTLREFLEEYGLSQCKLALELRVPARRINAIVKGSRGITADTAVRLGRFFGNSPDFWLNLQKAYDLEEAKDYLSDELRKIHPIACMA